ncbi:type 1 glutamine amidotransferase [Salicibibacter cibi]|uniref:Type 1 glutamine amidotransferase n=1 Tax=Salicibibacter cibi TaxID=2743001 RepID=A0A7T6Z852_9BACI|nr:type 1 glutamine amidotransferase [Salicibibacter cibi]QQK78721.1 type 1 glutamine amidotransferase [Salicibibacter cibi]
MNTHYLQHAPFETPGIIFQWAEEKEHTLTSTFLPENTGFPNLQDIDLLILLGGPMSVHDEKKHPWLADEKNFLKKAIANKKTAILGIGLGARLLAEQYGARVYREAESEIGWFPVTFNESAHSHPFFSIFPAEMIALHRRGEAFESPRNVISLACSEEYGQQAFISEDSRHIGLHFHPEMTKHSVDDFIFQSEKEPVIDFETMKGMDQHYAANQSHLFELLDRWLARHKDGIPHGI